MKYLYFLAANDQLLLKSPRGKYVVNGPCTFIKPPLFHTVITARSAITLESNQYCHIKDQLTGDLTMIEGPNFFFLDAYEEISFRDEAITVAKDQYFEVVDETTGETRIIRGECSYKLRPFEKIDGELKQAVHIDDQTAVIVRDLNTGSLKMITEKQIFIPDSDQEIEKIIKKVLVEEHEVVVLKDLEGKYHFHKGRDENSSFFIPPYWEVLNFRWSSGLHKDERNLHIHKFDLRPKFMWYEFDVRTRDNVELSLKVTLFWQVLDVEVLVSATDDASGDVCSHIRSKIIQKVSQYDFSDFLAGFNGLVHDAIFDQNDMFYEERGLIIHSVEVREITCKDQKTQDVLAEIIQETTTRINRIQKQVSENEVTMKRIEGELLAEEAEMQLLEKRLIRYREESQAEGNRQAQVISAFLDGLGNGMSLDQKLKAFEILRKKEMMEALATNNTRIFLTPQDIDLKLDVKD